MYTYSLADGTLRIYNNALFANSIYLGKRNEGQTNYQCAFAQRVAVLRHASRVSDTSQPDWAFDTLQYHNTPFTPHNVSTLYEGDGPHKGVISGTQQTHTAMRLSYGESLLRISDPSVVVFLASRCDQSNATNETMLSSVITWRDAPSVSMQNTAIHLSPKNAVREAVFCLGYQNSRGEARIAAVSKAFATYDKTSISGGSVFLRSGGNDYTALAPKATIPLNTPIVISFKGTGLNTLSSGDRVRVVKIPVSAVPILLNGSALESNLDALCNGRGVVVGKWQDLTEGNSSLSSVRLVEESVVVADTFFAAHLQDGNSRAQLHSWTSLSMSSATGDFVTCYQHFGSIFRHIPLDNRSIFTVVNGSQSTPWVSIVGISQRFFAENGAHLKAVLAAAVTPMIPSSSVTFLQPPKGWLDTTMSFRFDTIHPSLQYARQAAALLSDTAQQYLWIKRMSLTCAYCTPLCSPLSLNDTEYCPKLGISVYLGAVTDYSYSSFSCIVGNPVKVEVVVPEGAEDPIRWDELRIVFGVLPTFGVTTAGAKTRCNDAEYAYTFAPDAPASNRTHRVFSVHFDTSRGGNDSSQLRIAPATQLGRLLPPPALCYKIPNDPQQFRPITSFTTQFYATQLFNYTTTPSPPFANLPFKVIIHGANLAPEGTDDAIVLVYSGNCSDAVFSSSSSSNTTAVTIFAETALSTEYDTSRTPVGRSAVFISNWTALPLETSVCYYPGVSYGNSHFETVRHPFGETIHSTKPLHIDERPGYIKILGPALKHITGSGVADVTKTLIVAFYSSITEQPLPNTGAVCRVVLSVERLYNEASTALLAQYSLVGTTSVTAVGAVCTFTGFGGPANVFGKGRLIVTATLTDGSQLSSEANVSINKPCLPEVTCSGKGSCDERGECVCSAHYTKGFWAGAACATCAKGFYGTSCQIFCGPQSCQNSGSCAPQGSCSCPATHKGPFCDLCTSPNRQPPGCSCSPNYYGTQCDVFCDPKTTCSGHGVCDAGGCQCDVRYGGPRCNECAVGWMGVGCGDVDATVWGVPEANIISGAQCTGFIVTSAELMLDRSAVNIVFSDDIIPPPQATTTLACNNYFMNLTSGVLCRWLQPSHLVITFQMQTPLLSPGESIKIRPNRFIATNLYKNCDLPNPLITVSSPRGGVPGLQIALMGPSVVSSCGVAVFRVYASMGEGVPQGLAGTALGRGGRAMRAIKWRASGNADLDEFLKNSENAESVSIPPQILPAGSHDIAVTVQDYWGQSGTSQTVFSKLRLSEERLEKGAAPALTVEHSGRKMSFFSDESVALRLAVNTGKCVFGGNVSTTITRPKDEQSYTFAWSVRDTFSRSVSTLPLFALSHRPDATLQFPKGYLSPLFAPYTVTVVATSLLSPRIVESISNIEIFIEPQPIDVSILGATTIVSGGIYDLSASCIDPEVARSQPGARTPPSTMRFTWGCSLIEGVANDVARTGQKCPLLAVGSFLEQPTFTIAADAPVGVYSVSLYCSVAWVSSVVPYTRNATAAVNVVVKANNVANGHKSERYERGAEVLSGGVHSNKTNITNGSDTSTTGGRMTTSSHRSAEGLAVRNIGFAELVASQFRLEANFAAFIPNIVAIRDDDDNTLHFIPSVSILPDGGGGGGGISPEVISATAVAGHCVSHPELNISVVPNEFFPGDTLLLEKGQLMADTEYIFSVDIAVTLIDKDNTTQADLQILHNSVVGFRTTRSLEGGGITMNTVGSDGGVTSLSQIVVETYGWGGGGSMRAVEANGGVAYLQYQWSLQEGGRGAEILQSWTRSPICRFYVPYHAVHKVFTVTVAVKDQYGTVAYFRKHIASAPALLISGVRILPEIPTWLGGVGEGMSYPTLRVLLTHFLRRLGHSRALSGTEMAGVREIATLIHRFFVKNEEYISQFEAEVTHSVLWKDAGRHLRRAGRGVPGRFALSLHEGESVTANFPFFADMLTLLNIDGLDRATYVVRGDALIALSHLLEYDVVARGHREKAAGQGGAAISSPSRKELHYTSEEVLAVVRLCVTHKVTSRLMVPLSLVGAPVKNAVAVVLGYISELLRGFRNMTEFGVFLKDVFEDVVPALSFAVSGGHTTVLHFNSTSNTSQSNTLHCLRTLPSTVADATVPFSMQYATPHDNTTLDTCLVTWHDNIFTLLDSKANGSASAPSYYKPQNATIYSFYSHSTGSFSKAKSSSSSGVLQIKVTMLPHEEGCAVYDPKNHQFSHVCERIAAATPYCLCIVKAVDLPIHIAAVDVRKFTASPTEMPPLEEEALLLFNEAKEGGSYSALYGFVVFVVVLAAGLLRVRALEGRAFNGDVLLWNKITDTVDDSAATLAARGVTKGALVGGSALEVVEFLVSRRKALCFASESALFWYTQMVLYVDCNIWLRLVCGMLPRKKGERHRYFPPSSLRYTAVRATERAAIVCLLLLLPPFVVCSFIALQRSVSFSVSSIVLIAIIDAVIIAGVGRLALYLPTEVEVELQGNGETETEMSIQETAETIDPNNTTIEAPKESNDNVSGEAPHISSVVGTSTESINVRRKPSFGNFGDFKGEKNEYSNSENVPNTTHRPSAFARRSSTKGSGRRVSYAMESRASSIAQSAANAPFMLTLPELEMVFFEEVRDARLHTAASLQYMKALYSQGLFGTVSSNETVSPDFFAVAAEEVDTAVGALFRVTYATLDAADTSSLFQARFSCPAPKDITPEELYSELWKMEETQNRFFLPAKEACKMRSLKLAGILYQLGLLSESPELYTVYNHKKPPQDVAEMVDTIVSYPYNVGLLFAARYCTMELGVSEEEVLRMYTESVLPSRVEVEAIAFLRVNTSWRCWAIPGRSPYPIPMVDEEQTVSKIADLIKTSPLKACHAISLKNDDFEGYELPECRNNQTFCRMFVLWFCTSLGCVKENVAEAILREEAGLVAEQVERVVSGVEKLAPRPPQEHLANARNEWLSYYLNYRLHSIRGGVFCTPICAQYSSSSSSVPPFFSLIQLAPYPGVREGSGTKSNPFNGFQASLFDVRDGDTVILRPGKYTEFQINGVIPLEVEEPNLAFSFRVCSEGWWEEKRGGEAGGRVCVEGGVAVRVQHSTNVAVCGVEVNGVVDAVESKGVRLDVGDVEVRQSRLADGPDMKGAAKRNRLRRRVVLCGWSVSVLAVVAVVCHTTYTFTPDEASDFILTCVLLWPLELLLLQPLLALGVLSAVRVVRGSRQVNWDPFRAEAALSLEE